MHEPHGAQTAAPIDLATLGWATASRRLPAETNLDHHDPARVMRVDGPKLFACLGDGGPPIHVLDRTGTDEPACVGDWVLVGPATAEGALRPATTKLPRAGTIGRRREGGDGSRKQVLAANVDVAIIVESLAPQPPNVGRLRRLVVLAASGGVEPLPVLTKCDLHPGGEEVAVEVERELAGLVPRGSVLLTSAGDGTGMPELAARLPRGCTAVLVGASGGGKSTLANRLLGREAQATGHVHGQTGTGRHVTSAGQLLVLPGGGMLIDTPGIRGIGMHHDVDPQMLASTELTDLAARCRFADCAHEREPGCAVQEAIAGGQLPETAVTEWRALLREMEREAAKHDARLKAERSKRLRRQGRDHARYQRANPRGLTP